MTIKNSFLITQKVGVADKNGSVSVEFTYDEVDTKLKGESMPMKTMFDHMFDQLIGQKMQITVNKQGEITDFKLPPVLGMSEDSFKILFKSFYGQLPQTPVGVGEVATSPLAFNIPFPITGDPSLKIDGTLNSKLVSIENDATGHLANFSQTMDGKIVSDMELSKTDKQFKKMNLDLNLNGGGNITINVDKGVIKSSDSKVVVTGKLKTIGESDSKPMSFNAQVTVNATITGSY